MPETDRSWSAEVSERVVRATDNWNELAARFVVPVRSARLVKDGVTRQVLDRFATEGIPIASATSEVTVHLDPPAPRNASEPTVENGGRLDPTA